MTTIHFEALESEFARRGTGFYKATADGLPIRAGITNEAWIHLLPAHHGPMDELSNLGHPAHRIAQDLIREKYEATGPDKSGAVVVTFNDLILGTADRSRLCS
ncbi:hypothetical protein [Sphingomonas oryzagri]